MKGNSRRAERQFCNVLTEIVRSSETWRSFSRVGTSDGLTGFIWRQDLERLVKVGWVSFVSSIRMMTISGPVRLLLSWPAWSQRETRAGGIGIASADSITIAKMVVAEFEIWWCGGEIKNEIAYVVGLIDAAPDELILIGIPLQAELISGFMGHLRGNVLRIA
jgi:hypothetical protein